VHVVGENRLCVSIVAALAEAEITVASGISSQVGVVVLSLSSSEGVVRTVAEQVVRGKKPVVVCASAGARVYVAMLQPPRTACPLCLSRRIRACRPDRALGSLPLDMLLGVSSDTHWPSNAAAAGLIAHQALRVIANPESTESGLAELIELNLDTCQSVHHPLLHTPLCPVCSEQVPHPPKVMMLRDRPAVCLDESWRRMQRAVDPLTGIVAGIRLIAPGDADSTVDCAVAWAQGGTDTTWFSPVRSSTVGGATKHDPLNAQVCALGELLERYSAGIYDPAQFLRASLSELGPAAVDPRNLPLGSAREYETMSGKLFPYHPDLVIDWVEGVELCTGEQRYVPACAVYVPYRAPQKSERLLNPVSTGLAAGSTPVQAVRGGLLEVIERDAVAIFWYNRLTVPTLDWQSLPPGPARTVLERIRSRGIELLAKDITTDIGIPAVVVLGRIQTPERPVALCGFRADLDPYACLLGAAEELEHVVSMYWRFTKRGGVLDVTAEPSDIWDFATYYCHASRASVLDFMYGGPLRPVPSRTSEPLSDAAAITHILDRLSVSKYHPIAIDITPVDVAESGVSVVRTLIPGLQPISFNPQFRHLGGRRVYEAPVRMGLRDTELAEHELNSYPAPLG
jgi:ribosomal protein S12 methylthiotransferase accessory factor